MPTASTTVHALQAENDRLRQHNQELKQQLAAARAAQAAAETERQHLYELLMQAPVPFCLFRGPQHIYHMVNQAYLAMINRGDVLGKTVREVWPEAADQGFFELFDQLFATGLPYQRDEVPVRLRRSSQGEGKAEEEMQEVWFNLFYQPICTSDNQVEGILHIAFDVTDQVRARREVETRNVEHEHLNQRLMQQVRERTRQLEQQTAELQEKRALLQGILDNAPAMIYVKDTTGRYLLVNQHVASLMHCAIDDIVGKQEYDMFPREAVDAWQASDQQVLRTRQPLIWEETVPIEGKLRTSIVNKFPLLNEQGEVYALAGIITDISERKQAEEALRESQERLQFVLEGSNDGAWDWNIAEHTAYLSPRYKEMIGYQPDELPDAVESWTAMIHPDDESKVHKQLWDYLEGRNPVYAVEHRLLHRSGEWRWMLTRGKIMTRDAQGQPTRMTGIITDITERKQVEEALRESQMLLQGILDNSPMAIYVKDIDGRFLLVNQQAASLMQMPAQEIMGKYEHELFPPEIVALWQSNKQRVLEQRAPIAFEETFPIADKMHTYLSFRFPLFDQEGKIYATAGISTDITERKQAEEALRISQERLQRLSRRLVTIQEEERRYLAHELHDEIGQLLTGLKLSLGMLHHSANEQTRAILDEGRVIVGDLMNRVRTLSLNLRPSILDDLGVLPALEWHFERYTAQTSIQVILQHHGLQQRFSADTETAIYRIIQEALTNTARYAGVDVVQVSLWADGTSIRIHIDDEGQGFEPAAALASHSSAGLAGMHERVELLNGRLTVESAPGQGTHIIAELPLHVSPPR